MNEKRKKLHADQHRYQQSNFPELVAISPIERRKPVETDGTSDTGITSTSQSERGPSPLHHHHHRHHDVDVDHDHDHDHRDDQVLHRVVQQNQRLVSQLEATVVELKEATFKIHQMETKIDRLTEEKFEIDEKLADRDGEIEVLEKQLHSCENQIELAQQKLVDKQSELDNVLRTAASNRQELEHSLTTCKRLGEQNVDVVSTSEKLVERLESHESRIKELRASESALRKTNGQLLKERREIFDKNKQLEQRVGELNERCQRAVQQKSKADFRLSKHNGQLQDELKECHEKISILQRELEDYNKVKSENQKLMDAVAKQEQRVTGLQHELLQLRTSNSVFATTNGYLATSTTTSTSAAAFFPQQPAGTDVQDASTGQPAVTPAVASQLVQAGVPLSVVPVGAGGSSEVFRMAEHIERLRQEALKQLADCQKELNEKKSDCQELLAKIALKESQTSEARAALKSRERNVRQLEDELAKLRETVTRAEKEKTSRLVELEVKRNKVNELQAKLNDQTLTVNELRCRVDECNAELQRLSTAGDKTKQTYTEMERQWRDELRVVINERDAVQLRISELERNLSAVEEHLREKEALTLELSGQIERYEAEIASTRQQSDTMVENFKKKSSSSVRQVKSMQGLLEKCKSEIATYREELERSKKTFDEALRTANERLVEQQQISNRLKRELEAKETKLVDFRANLEQQSRVIGGSSARVQELEASELVLQKEITQLQADYGKQLTELHSKIELLTRELADSRSKLQERDNANEMTEERCRRAESNCTRLANEKKTLEEDVGEKEAECQELERKLSESRTKAQQIQAICDQHVVKMVEMESEINGKQENNGKLANEISRLENELYRAKVDLERALLDIKEMDTNQSKLCKGIKEREALIAKLKQKNWKLERALQSTEQRVEALDDQLKVKNNDLASKERKLSQLDDAVRTHSSDMQARVDRLEQQLNVARKEAEARNGQVADLERQLQRMHDELVDEQTAGSEQQMANQRLREQIGSKDDLLRQSACQVDVLKQTVSDLKHDLAEKSREIEAARNQSIEFQMKAMQAENRIGELVRQKNQMSRDIQDLVKNSQSKDSDLTRLAEQLGGSQLRQQELESRGAVEVQKMREEFCSIQAKFRQQLDEVQKNHQQELQRLQAEHQAQLRSLQNAEQAETNIVGQLSSEISQLQRRLDQMKIDLDTANQNAYLKEAEIERLKSKLAVRRCEAASSGAHNKTSSSTVNGSRRSRFDGSYKKHRSAGKAAKGGSTEEDDDATALMRLRASIQARFQQLDLNASSMGTGAASSTASQHGRLEWDPSLDPPKDDLNSADSSRLHNDGSNSCPSSLSATPRKTAVPPDGPTAAGRALSDDRSAAADELVTPTLTMTSPLDASTPNVKVDRSGQPADNQTHSTLSFGEPISELSASLQSSLDRSLAKRLFGEENNQTPSGSSLATEPRNVCFLDELSTAIDMDGLATVKDSIKGVEYQIKTNALKRKQIESRILALQRETDMAIAADDDGFSSEGEPP